MTTALIGHEMAQRLEQVVPGSVEETNETDVWVKSEALSDVMRWLKEDKDLDMSFLNSVTGVDYIEFFEMVYHLTSIRHNQSLVIKTRIFDREDPEVPSVINLWRGADYQEREVWDLMGIRFKGHPNPKRIMLWDGFPGHPLRKDFIESPYPEGWPHGG